MVTILDWALPIIVWSIIILLILPKKESVKITKAFNNKIVKNSTAGQLFKAGIDRVNSAKEFSFKGLCKRISDGYDK